MPRKKKQPQVVMSAFDAAFAEYATMNKPPRKGSRLADIVKEAYSSIKARIAEGWTYEQICEVLPKAYPDDDAKMFRPNTVRKYVSDITIELKKQAETETDTNGEQG